MYCSLIYPIVLGIKLENKRIIVVKNFVNLTLEYIIAYCLSHTVQYIYIFYTAHLLYKKALWFYMVTICSTVFYSEMMFQTVCYMISLCHISFSNWRPVIISEIKILLCILNLIF